MIVITIIGILIAIPISSYLGFRDRANDATAEANIHVVVPSLIAYYSDHGTYASMTLDALAQGYDRGLDESRYELTSVGADTYCITTDSGGRSWRKAGPAEPVQSGSCP